MRRSKFLTSLNTMVGATGIDVDMCLFEFRISTSIVIGFVTLLLITLLLAFVTWKSENKLKSLLIAFFLLLHVVVLFLFFLYCFNRIMLCQVISWFEEIAKDGLVPIYTSMVIGSFVYILSRFNNYLERQRIKKPFRKSESKIPRVPSGEWQLNQNSSDFYLQNDSVKKSINDVLFSFTHVGRSGLINEIRMKILKGEVANEITASMNKRIELLAALISNNLNHTQYNPFISVEGNWGSGKTTLLNLSIDHLEESLKSTCDKHNVVFIRPSAFTYSYADPHEFINDVLTSVFKYFDAFFPRKLKVKKYKSTIINNLSSDLSDTDKLMSIFKEFKVTKGILTDEVVERINSKYLYSYSEVSDRPIVYLVVDDIDRLDPKAIRTIFSFLYVLKSIFFIRIITLSDMDEIFLMLERNKVGVSDPTGFFRKLEARKIDVSPKYHQIKSLGIETIKLYYETLYGSESSHNYEIDWTLCMVDYLEHYFNPLFMENIIIRAVLGDLKIGTTARPDFTQYESDRNSKMLRQYIAFQKIARNINRIHGRKYNESKYLYGFHAGRTHDRSSIYERYKIKSYVTNMRKDIQETTNNMNDAISSYKSLIEPLITRYMNAYSDQLKLSYRDFQTVISKHLEYVCYGYNGFNRKDVDQEVFAQLFIERFGDGSDEDFYDRLGQEES